MSKPENWYVVRYDDPPAVIALRSEREIENLTLGRTVAERLASLLTTVLLPRHAPAPERR